MDLRTRLRIIYSDGGSETDYSMEAQDFKRDNFQITMTTDDFIYVGFYKSINALYAQIETANTIQSSITMEYFKDTSVWANLEHSDDTKAFSRSGFITWQRPEDAANTTVGGFDLCWVRISTNDDIDPVTFQALNLVFSDDNDICQETPSLIDSCFYQSGQTSHILNHVAAKNYIMGRLRSLGYIKYTSSGEENITEWDVLDVYELRLASTYYAISQIYFNLSDDVEDQYWSKYQNYVQRFDDTFNLGRLRIDTDDDGQVDLNEKRPIKSLRWNR